MSSGTAGIVVCSHTPAHTLPPSPNTALRYMERTSHPTLTENILGTLHSNHSVTLTPHRHRHRRTGKHSIFDRSADVLSIIIFLAIFPSPIPLLSKLTSANDRRSKLPAFFKPLKFFCMIFVGARAPKVRCACWHCSPVKPILRCRPTTNACGQWYSSTRCS